MTSANHIFHQIKRAILTGVGICLFAGCTEPYEGDVENFDDVLVVNAVITNENKRQEVKLTRSYRFEEDGPEPEIGAQVVVNDGNGGEFTFEEELPGTYLSTNAFTAELDNAYSLSIVTSAGKAYESTPSRLPSGSNVIDRLYAERTTDENGNDGMGIFVDTFDPSQTSNLYRYDFIETYKIIAPLWIPFDLVYLGESVFGPILEVILREREEQVCYGSQRAKSINLANTSNLSENRLTKYPIQFIDRDNYILSYRYSILVKQFIQNPEAFAYYETLQGLVGSTGGVFSEDQPGFLAGNVFSIDDTSENVSGYFEIASVSEKRIFFNYEDFYPNEELPPYFLECTTIERQVNSELVQLIADETQVLFSAEQARIFTTQRDCGDCTRLGSNKVPEFWEE